jgi:hypothetical protein
MTATLSGEELHAALHAENDEYDWQEVFAIAGDPAGGSNLPDLQTVPPGAETSHTHFGRSDVALVEWMELGENDGPDWLIGGQLRDGRWFFIAAGCDYTGWDCQSGGRAYVADSRYLIERFGMDDDERRRLGVELAEQT